MPIVSYQYGNETRSVDIPPGATPTTMLDLGDYGPASFNNLLEAYRTSTYAGNVPSSLQNLKDALAQHFNITGQEQTQRRRQWEYEQRERDAAASAGYTPQRTAELTFESMR